MANGSGSVRGGYLVLVPRYAPASASYLREGAAHADGVADTTDIGAPEFSRRSNYDLTVHAPTRAGRPSVASQLISSSLPRRPFRAPTRSPSMRAGWRHGGAAAPDHSNDSFPHRFLDVIRHVFRGMIGLCCFSVRQFALRLKYLLRLA